MRYRGRRVNVGVINGIYCSNDNIILKAVAFMSVPRAHALTVLLWTVRIRLVMCIYALLAIKKRYMLLVQIQTPPLCFILSLRLINIAKCACRISEQASRLASYTYPTLPLKADNFFYEIRFYAGAVKYDPAGFRNLANDLFCIAARLRIMRFNVNILGFRHVKKKNNNNNMWFWPESVLL